MTSESSAVILDVLPSASELGSLEVNLCLSISKKLFS